MGSDFKFILEIFDNVQGDKYTCLTNGLVIKMITFPPSPPLLAFLYLVGLEFIQNIGNILENRQSWSKLK